VHALPDTAAALQTLLGPRQKLGFRLLHQPTPIVLHDGGGDLCLKIVACGSGWSLRSRKGQQELQFSQLWAGESGELFFSLNLEQKDASVQQINVDFTVFQKMRRDNAQVMEVEVDFSVLSSPLLHSSKDSHHHQHNSKETFHSSRSSVSKEANVNLGHSSRTNLSKESNPGHTSRTSATSAASACSSLGGSLVGSSLVGSSSGCSSLPASPLQAFKLPAEVRAALCSALDQEQASGVDWRSLAVGLRLGRHLDFYRHRPSPTDCLLSLWEAQQTEQAAITDLLNIVRVIGRPEVAARLEKEVGSWV